MTPQRQARPGARAIWGRSLAVWAAMILLLAVAAITAHVPLGPLNTPIVLACAAVEVVLVAIFGMELGRSEALLRLAAIAGVIWLCIMFGLTLNDILTRAM